MTVTRTKAEVIANQDSYLLKVKLIKLFQDYISSRKGLITQVFRNTKLTAEKLEEIVAPTIKLLKEFEGTPEELIKKLQQGLIAHAEISIKHGKFHTNLFEKNSYNPENQSGLADVFHQAMKEIQAIKRCQPYLYSLPSASAGHPRAVTNDNPSTLYSRQALSLDQTKTHRGACMLKAELIKDLKRYRSSRSGLVTTLFRNTALTREKLAMIVEPLISFIQNFEGSKNDLIEHLNKKRLEHAMLSLTHGKPHYNLVESRSSYFYRDKFPSANESGLTGVLESLVEKLKQSNMQHFKPLHDFASENARRCVK